jgi:hypothetical protein
VIGLTERSDRSSSERDLQVTCPEAFFRTNSEKYRNNVSGTVHSAPFSGYPWQYRGRKKD